MSALGCYEKFRMAQCTALFTLEQPMDQRRDSSAKSYSHKDF